MLSCSLHNCLGVFGQSLFVGDVETKELQTLKPLHYSTVDVTQSWVNREYTPEGPLLRISVTDVGATGKEVQDPVAEGGV